MLFILSLSSRHSLKSYCYFVIVIVLLLFVYILCIYMHKSYHTIAYVKINSCAAPGRQMG